MADENDDIEKKALEQQAIKAQSIPKEEILKLIRGSMTGAQIAELDNLFSRGGAQNIKKALELIRRGGVDISILPPQSHEELTALKATAGFETENKIPDIKTNNIKTGSSKTRTADKADPSNLLNNR